MPEILADECVRLKLVFRLRRLGYLVRTVRDFCNSKYGDGIADQSVLELACQHRLAVLTTNESDFLKLHQNFPGHYGILIIKSEDDVRAQARRIDNKLKELDDIRGRIVWLKRISDTPLLPRPRKRRGG